MSTIYPPTPYLRLEPHPTARSKATAAELLQPGAIVLSVPSLSTCLLQTEKGRRCDGCHSLPSAGAKLKRCSGCASYWYCGTTCQAKEWKAHHRKMCKSYSRYVATSEYQSLSPHDQVDAHLLSQLLAELFPDDTYSHPAEDGTPLTTVMDLMKGPESAATPPILYSHPNISAWNVIAEELYLRFGNNNFILHSHLNSYAHGIFPLASRLLNHSCVPNAVTKYIITPSECVRMEVVALRPIAAGEEVTIPYLDPALPFNTRQEALRANYGFTCACLLCSFSQHLKCPLPPERGTEALDLLEAQLREFALGRQDRLVQLRTDLHCFERVPETLYSLFHESYLPGISELFSRASHEGPYNDAVAMGLTLLALYVVRYPANYPQIGMHALELAKTAWNAVVTLDQAETDSLRARQMEETAHSCLVVASQVLHHFGMEGDEGGPRAEVAIMQELLSGR
ncbi:SET domain-containing protein [Amylocystis lapponica]|nr:SET domain-containing protein [Amylocystis lapponica]